jgi:peptidoglycan/LPS O-acetylase OafA/YrhL
MKNSPSITGSTQNFSIGNYYPALDGLRGLAIILIILYHNFDYVSVFRPVWIGVDLFFVLSGFLITGILLKKRDSGHYLRNFYARRVLRIFPIYYLSIVILLFILPHLITYPFSLKYLLANQQWFWLDIQNWLFILKPGGNNNFLNHFWSLALEEQFYLVIPWIILLIKPVQSIISFLLIILLLTLSLRLIVWFHSFENISYIDLYAFTRIDGLCVGSLLAIFSFQGNLRMRTINKLIVLLFFILIFIVLPFFKIFFHIRLPYTACCLFPGVALFWGLIVWSSINPESFMYKIFNSRVLIFFGKISYGLYIFHWPILRLFLSDAVNLAIRQDSLVNNLFISVISASIAIILAIVSYYTYERFFLGLKKYFT